jgi:hypothetical protein
MPCSPPRRALNPMRRNIFAALTETSPSPALAALDSSIQQIMAVMAPSGQAHGLDMEVTVAAPSAKPTSAFHNELAWPPRSGACTMAQAPAGLSHRRLSFTSEHGPWPLLNASH